MQYTRIKIICWNDQGLKQSLCPCDRNWASEQHYSFSILSAQDDVTHMTQQYDKLNDISSNYFHIFNKSNVSFENEIYHT
jgi:hypothetical protein